MSSDKTIVLITSCSQRGIGYLTADALAASPSNYEIIATSRSLEKTHASVVALKKVHPTASFSLIQLDVIDAKSIADAAAQVTKKFGCLDVLINNAGFVSMKPALGDSLRESFETNTIGPALLTEALLPLLSKSSDPRLIHISSETGSLTLRSTAGPYYKPMAPAYRISKTALNMLMLHHHVSLGGNLKVWAFCPGYVVTNLSGESEGARQKRVDNGAGDAVVSARALVRIVEGGRDGECGLFVNGEGVLPW